MIKCAQYNKLSYCAQAASWSIFGASNKSALVMMSFLNPQATAKLQRPRHNQNYDGFLYQCRVSPKISACVGGNRNGEQNGFLRRFTLRSFPGNECIVENGAILYSRLGTINPRVLVLIARTLKKGSKASISLSDG